MGVIFFHKIFMLSNINPNNSFKMKRYFYVILLFFSYTYVGAQEVNDTCRLRPLSSINLSILGDASLISLRYERIYSIKPNLHLSAKLGVGYNEEFNICIYSPRPEPHKYTTIPHHVTCNIGFSKHFFEVGLGGTVIMGKTTQPYILYPILGYRFQSLKKKLNFKIFVEYPFSGAETDDILFVPVGVSIGETY